MKPITKEHNEFDIKVELGLSLIFAVCYIVYSHWIYLLGGVVFLGLAMFRRYWLADKI